MFIHSFEFFLFSFSVKSDTKWISWIAYQFHMAAIKQRYNSDAKDSMDLETFKSSFYFKIVCP
jgi:hypothetical protein